MGREALFAHAHLIYSAPIPQRIIQDVSHQVAASAPPWQGKASSPISRTDIMPKPRKALVSLEATPYYHCVSRCVRRAILCGDDAQSGKSHEHHRQWIEDRMKTLAAG
jgi:hypothetical protein